MSQGCYFHKNRKPMFNPSQILQEFSFFSFKLSWIYSSFVAHISSVILIEAKIIEWVVTVVFWWDTHSRRRTRPRFPLLWEQLWDSLFISPPFPLSYWLMTLCLDWHLLSISKAQECRAILGEERQRVTRELSSRIPRISGSQSVGWDPGDQKTLSQGSPKTIGKPRDLHYDS